MIREDYPLYPPLATREAIANAICHRDYVTQGGAVAIAMYDDRLEVINPGILHFDITPEKLSKPHESKPWNPIIASVFYRAGVIEKWGMGTLNIIEKCIENSNPPAKWEVRAQSVVATFLPSSFFATGQKEPESRPESLESEILSLLKEKALSKGQISKAMGHKHISGGLKKTLSNLLKKGGITYTIPEKPDSRHQQYKIVKMDRAEPKPNSLESEILNLLKRKALSKSELSAAMGHKHISGGLKKTLTSLLKKEKIVHTIPEKPSSRHQKYKLNT